MFLLICSYLYRLFLIFFVVGFSLQWLLQILRYKILDIFPPFRDIQSMNIKMDNRDLRKFSKTMGNAPKQLNKAVANYLNTSAFTHRTLNIKSLQEKMTIRDQRFLGMNLKVEKAKPVSINQQIAISGSITRKNFTGWKEAQEGTRPVRKRVTTPKSRGGSMGGKVQNKYRLKPSNKIYKPEQFDGRTLNSRFYFMMRVIGSRGGGQFLISESIKTKRGQLNKGLYTLQGGKVSMLQKTEDNQKARQIKWQSEDWVKVREKAQKEYDLKMTEYLSKNLHK